MEIMSVTSNLQDIRATLPKGVTLVAVSKFHPVEAIAEAYEAGQRIFGESRVQELVAKHRSLPADIEWHMIGHLQTNKVKYIAPFVSMISSVDRSSSFSKSFFMVVIPFIVGLLVGEGDTRLFEKSLAKTFKKGLNWI